MDTHRPTPAGKAPRRPDSFAISAASSLSPAFALPPCGDAGASPTTPPAPAIDYHAPARAGVGCLSAGLVISAGVGVAALAVILLTLVPALEPWQREGFYQLHKLTGAGFGEMAEAAHVVLLVALGCVVASAVGCLVTGSRLLAAWQARRAGTGTAR